MPSTSMINNGDYYRVLQGGIHIPAWSDQDLTCYPIGEALAMPTSTMGMFFQLSLLVHKALGINHFCQNSMFAVLLIVYLAGMFFYLREVNYAIAKAISLLLPLFLFSFFLHSYYEEAIIIPLLPWVMLGVHQLLQYKKLLLFTITASLFVFAKSQMAIFLPFYLFLLYKNYPRRKWGIWSGILSAVFIIILGINANITKQNNHLPNAFNRFFNGIGWTLQNVPEWPARDFNTRREYFYAHQPQLQHNSDIQTQILEPNLFGSSYWPTGSDIFDSNQDALKQKINEEISLRNYFRFISDHPSFLFKFVQSIYRVLATSDYTMSYLRHADAAANDQLFRLMNEVILNAVGIAYFVLLLFLVVMCNARSRLVFVALYLGLPVTVVVGDGYYEFEKHMLTYFMTLPLFFCDVKQFPLFKKYVR